MKKVLKILMIVCGYSWLQELESWLALWRLNNSAGRVKSGNPDQLWCADGLITKKDVDSIILKTAGMLKGKPLDISIPDRSRRRFANRPTWQK